MRILAVELEPKDVVDIVHNAIEGGINYWGECKGYKWTEWYEPDPNRSTDSVQFERVKELPEDYVYVYVREDEDQGDPTRDPNTWVPIRKADVARGLALALAKHPHLYTARDSELDTDATGAEVVIQYAIFGELVYG
ncbi:MAG: hypothetical protein EBS90_07040 [Betaproteobacteria bacterium]|nr:hypothetical protein [Betaproteobacteria bacterium]